MELNKKNYVYHFVPENMRGAILYPLNELKDLMPDIANIHIDKYAERPELMEKRLQILDCLWNDVLHFVAVPPEEIKKLYVEADFTKAAKTVKRYYKVPVEMLDPSKTIVYTWSKNNIEHFESKEDIQAMKEFKMTIPFDPSHIEEYAQPPRNTLAYYKYIKATKQKQFMVYHFVPHILYKGTIDTAGIEIIEV